jgi:hypothetical protein
MLATFAQLERDFIAQRTSEALAIKIEQGVKVGRSNSADPKVIADIRRIRESGMSWPKIAAHLNDEGVPTSQGGAKWHPMTCKRLAESDRLGFLTWPLALRFGVFTLRAGAFEHRLFFVPRQATAGDAVGLQNRMFLDLLDCVRRAMVFGR